MILFPCFFVMFVSVKMCSRERHQVNMFFFIQFIIQAGPHMARNPGGQPTQLFDDLRSCRFREDI